MVCFVAKFEDESKATLSMLRGGTPCSCHPFPSATAGNNCCFGTAFRRRSTCTLKVVDMLSNNASQSFELAPTNIVMNFGIVFNQETRQNQRFPDQTSARRSHRNDQYWHRHLQRHLDIPDQNTNRLLGTRRSVIGVAVVT